MLKRIILATLGVALSAGALHAQQVEPEEFVLDNGMKFLLYPRTEQPNIIAAGWVAKVGSANERPGITGISHFFEHMMFKGTNTIGTDDSKQDLARRKSQRALHGRYLDLIYGEQYERWRRGEVTDPWDPEQFTGELDALRKELKDEMETHKEEIVNNEFDQVYTELGASGMNAFTSHDLTFYFINVPSNKFELWAWMESDRLDDSVFREFYSERDVVHEERRLRTESTPTGVFDEQLDAMFWQSSTYSWPVIGWTSDLNSYTEEQAWDYYHTYYQPSNLTGIIVGDFDPAQVKPMIREYFGRLSPGNKPVPEVVTIEMPQLAEKRMTAECDCQPQITVRYHTVPFNHKDEAALDMMSNILNGRTGRLYKSMVEGSEIAQSAFASNDSRKYGGLYEFSATTKGDASPEDLEMGWYAELDRLKTELVSEHELQKEKNQALANSYRRLQNNFFLLVQIGYYEGEGDWRYINEFPKRQQAVTPEDIMRVANEYFADTDRTVGVYYRKAGTGQEVDDNPLFLAMVEAIGLEQANMMKQQSKQFAQMSPEQLNGMFTMAQSQDMASMGPEERAVTAYMIDVIGKMVEQNNAAGDSE